VSSSLLTTALPPGVKMASEYTDADGVNLLVFGYPGVGKTTFITKAQDHEYGRDVILLDFEKGIRSVSDRDDVAVYRPPNNNWNDVENIKRWLLSADHGYKTIGVDTLTSLQQLAVESVTSGQPSQPEWGKANEKVLKLVRDFKELSVTKGINVLFTAHAKEIKDKDGDVYIRLDLTPQVENGVQRIVDALGYLEVDPTGKTGTRNMLFKKTRKVLAKYRQPESGPQLPLEIKDPSLGMILDHIHKGKE